MSYRDDTPPLRHGREGDRISKGESSRSRNHHYREERRASTSGREYEDPGRSRHNTGRTAEHGRGRRSDSRSRSRDRERRHHGQREGDSQTAEDQPHRRERSRSHERSRHRARGTSRDRTDRDKRDSHDQRDQHDHHPRRRSRSVSSYDDSDSSDSADDERRRRRRKERKREKEERRKHKERKREKKREKASATAASTASWGKYGIITEMDLPKKDSEFRAWLVEERKVNPEMISKERTRKEFAVFVEDYNTATLVHEKYYDLAKYEFRMNLIRSGQTLPLDVGTYDAMADMKAHTTHVKSMEEKKQSKLTRADVIELRRVEAERIEIGKRRLLGQEVPKNMGVRTEQVALESLNFD